MHAQFIKSAAAPNHFPESDLPQVAFVGRSNCGKSSLLNALVNRKDLARKSATPGRTQLINFFELNHKLILADLPGYGYSATGKSARLGWTKLMEAFFSRPELQHVLFLADVRRSLNDEDLNLLRYLIEHSSTTLVLTKSDKMTRSKLNQTIDFRKSELASLGIKLRNIVAVSALKKQGIEELRDHLWH